MTSDFYNKVYSAIEKIPKGKITTYKEIAQSLGTKAYQSVGTAVKKNPHAPYIPCHRVVKSSGEIGGYSGPGGVKRKKELLRKEGIEIKNNKVSEFNCVIYRLSQKEGENGENQCQT